MRHSMVRQYKLEKRSERANLLPGIIPPLWLMRLMSVMIKNPLKIPGSRQKNLKFKYIFYESFIVQTKLQNRVTKLI